ncbi:MAG: hypothetical protein D6679_09515 [Candidatus Hydrogenedentota bacterium]|nr:MAG: hypothetical protein D6679_09515 [Candidatus Hydrogenedentota bacterium]
MIRLVISDADQASAWSGRAVDESELSGTKGFCTLPRFHTADLEKILSGWCFVRSRISIRPGSPASFRTISSWSV